MLSHTYLEILKIYRAQADLRSIFSGNLEFSVNRLTTRSHVCG